MNIYSNEITKEVFKLIERTNPFKNIYSICNSGNSKEKISKLPEFPRYIDIELTNYCNFRCLMCPTGTSSAKRKKGMMDDSTYYKIINEIKPYKTPLRFIRWGEPSLHPKFLDYIKLAKSIGSIVHINTNGSKMDEEMMDELLKIPLDSIKFSFQGIDRKTFKEMRNIDFYDSLIECIKGLYTKRGNRKYPYIHVSTTITYETEEQVKEFKENVSKFVDLVTVGRTVLEHVHPENAKLSKEEMETFKILRQKESVIKKHHECPEVFDKLSINWDGSVSACCADYDNMMIVGNLEKNSLREIWTSEKMMFYREMLANMKHDDLELCKMCYEY